MAYYQNTGNQPLINPDQQPNPDHRQIAPMMYNTGVLNQDMELKPGSGDCYCYVCGKFTTRKCNYCPDYICETHYLVTRTGEHPQSCFKPECENAFNSTERKNSCSACICCLVIFSSMISFGLFFGLGLGP